MQRRDFLKVAGVGAGLLLVGACDSSDERQVPGFASKRRLPLIGRSSANIVVVGAGAWGTWTAYYLRRAGAAVTLVDAYGPGNSRSTSGDETRGIRSSYGDRETGELWMQWAREAITRWKAWDEEWSRDTKLSLFHTTGDLIMRAEWDPFLTKTKAAWEKFGIRHEVLTPDEVRKRWPVIQIDDITAVLSEPDAGVVRARRSVQAVAGAFEKLGGKIMTGRVIAPRAASGKVTEVVLESGETLRADAFVFACGPWLGKTFPELLGNRMRTPMGYVCYFGTPPRDNRFAFPNLPSFNFPGVTGWPTLPVDSRGFRVRGGSRAAAAPGAAGAATTGANGRGGAGAAPGSTRGTIPGGAPTTAVGAAGRAGSEAPAAPPRVATDTARGGRSGRTGRGGAGPGGGGANPPRPPVPPSQLDPDLSDRWADASRLEGPRRFITQRFPLLAEMPLLETRACHYEQTSSSNFIIDQHPQMENVWIAGGGNAEGFKFGPVVGEYVAQRVLGDVGDPEIAKGFKIPKDEYQTTPAPGTTAPAGSDTAGRGRGATPPATVRPPDDD
jgi:glycine/D-amino acid oxidase-like deaminating enzyme